MATVDLDALSNELTSVNGWFRLKDTYADAAFEHGRVVVGIDGSRGVAQISGGGFGELMDEAFWRGLDIIRRHVAPPAEPPTGEVVTILRDLAVRAADALEMIAREPSNWVASVNQPSADAACIRAALEGHAVPDLHAKLLEIFNASTTSYGAGDATCSDFDGPSAADAILQLLGYPAAERLKRAAAPVEEGEMPW